jgi:hypothetical protein
VGEPLSLAGLAVTATYDDASTKAVTGYTLTWGGVTLAEGNTAVTAEAGPKLIAVTYQEKAASFTVTVNAADTADTTAPGKVTGLTGTAGDGQVKLDWTDPADADLSAVEITWTPNGTTPVTVAKGAGTKDITGLNNGTAYTFTVVAVDSSGNKSAGETTGPYTPAATPDTTPPGPVTGLIVTPGNAMVKLTWTDPTDADLAGVRITFSPTAAGVTQPIWVQKTERQPVFIEGLENDIPYTFTVKAEDAAGNPSDGVSSEAVTPLSTLDIKPPGEVVVPSVQFTANSVILTWTDPDDADFASVEITWTPPDGPDSGSKSIAKGIGTYTAAGLTKGVTYTFMSRTKDTAGNLSEGTPGIFTPREPTAQVTVTFTGPEDEDITLTGADGVLSQSADTPLTVTVTGSYDAYRWALDGDILGSETGPSLTGSAGYLDVKRHTLTVFVTKNNVEYTKRVTFTVTK